MRRYLSKHVIAFSLFLLASGFLCTTLNAQTLYDNGPYFNRVGTGFGGADESVLYTTTFGMSTIGFGHQATSFNRIADDFAIGDCRWRIDSIVFFGYQTGSSTTSTFTGVNFRIWDSIPDAVGSSIVFGDTTTNRLTRTVFSGAYRITETTTGNSTRPIMRNVCALNNVVLTTGNFWLDWSSTGSLASGPWAPARTPANVAVTGNGRQRIGSTWNNALDGGTGTPAQGFPFIIYGTVLDPIVDAGIDQSVCPGNSVIIGGSPSGSGGQGPLTYAWSPNGSLSSGTDPNPIATPAGSTPYVLSVTDSTGCTVMDTVQVTVGAVASNFLIGDTTICANSNVVLDAGTANSYLWNTGDTTQTILVGGGTYHVAIDNGSGCLSVDTVVVTELQTVTIIGNGTICQQAGDTLTADLGPGTYNWNTGETTQMIVVNQSGMYSVTFTAPNGCVSVDTFSVVALPSPTAAFNFTVGGAGLAYTFGDLSTGNPTAYFWDFGDGNTATSASPSHTYAASGNYTVMLIATNSCGSDTTTQNLTVTDVQGSLPFATLSLSPNPARGHFTFTVSGMTMGDLKVDLMDLQGKICEHWQYAETAAGIQEQVDATKLAKGVYFLRFNSNDWVELRKVVLE
jgi:hypothetical protein